VGDQQDVTPGERAGACRAGDDRLVVGVRVQERHGVAGRRGQ
jgi:hypothetical protein